MSNRWKDAETILETLEKNGHEAYFVGGCVRDSLLQRPVKDIDITTSALPNEVIELFDQVIPTGIEHGTVLVRYNRQSFEVTTFRSEGTYTDQRRPDTVTFIPDLKEDLARRDFTINAMAMNKQYEVIDPYDGKKDLEAGNINTVGDARARFKEDALRMLRALRFTSQLGFSIDARTLIQMRLLKDEVTHVAIERIKEECEKLFQGDKVLNGVSLLRATEIESALPIFGTHPVFLDQLSEIVLTPFASFADVIALFRYLESDVSIQTWVKEWKCSNKEKNRAKALYTYVVYYNENGLDDWLAYQIDLAYMEAFCHLTRILFPGLEMQRNTICKQQAALPVRFRNEIDIDGNFVSALFPYRKKGSWIKKVIEAVEYLIVTKQLENKQSTIKEWILCHPPDKN